MRSTHLGYWGRFIWVVVEVREAILEQNIQISFSNRVNTADGSEACHSFIEYCQCAFEQN